MVQAHLASLPPSTEERCKYSGLRFRARDVHPRMLDEYMSGRNVVRISKLKTGPPTGDWVTIGVIKSAKIKLASTGSSYSIFGLTDLNGGDLLLFLFGEAQHKHWKEDAGGTIVALLSPEFKDNKDAKRERDSDNVPAYSINKEGQFHVLGKSKDYGICKSLRRDGQPCQNVCLPPYPTPQFPASKIPREREREKESFIRSNGRASRQLPACRARRTSEFVSSSGTYHVINVNIFHTHSCTGARVCEHVCLCARVGMRVHVDAHVHALAPASCARA